LFVRPFSGYAPAGGELLVYGDGHHTVQFVSVQAPQAYPDIQAYRRSLALVKVSEEDAYLVDVFEVTGGTQHDWQQSGASERIRTPPVFFGLATLSRDEPGYGCARGG